MGYGTDECPLCDSGEYALIIEELGMCASCYRQKSEALLAKCRALEITNKMLSEKLSALSKADD